MLITKTPLRIGLFGGGTDLESFWSQEEGAVLSCTINKYIYVIVNKSFDGAIHLRYFDNEDVNTVDEIKHDLIRESMRKAGINGGIEVIITSDIPHTGSGLGSSSSLTVGLLNAFYNYAGKAISCEKLAQEACEIEINILGNTIGKQDQYAAAYGGLNVFRFKPDGSVDVKAVKEKNYDVYSELQRHLLLFYTGKGHKAGNILSDQSKQVIHTRPILQKMKAQVESALEAADSNEIEKFGCLMTDGWEMKKQLSGSISNEFINDLIDRAKNAGATGVKITGAGGGGFLLAFCPIETQDLVKKALSDLPQTEICLEQAGSSLVFRDCD